MSKSWNCPSVLSHFGQSTGTVSRKAFSFAMYNMRCTIHADQHCRDPSSLQSFAMVPGKPTDSLKDRSYIFQKWLVLQISSFETSTNIRSGCDAAPEADTWCHWWWVSSLSCLLAVLLWLASECSRHLYLWMHLQHVCFWSKMSQIVSTGKVFFFPHPNHWCYHFLTGSELYTAILLPFWTGLPQLDSQKLQGTPKRCWYWRLLLRWELVLYLSRRLWSAFFLAEHGSTELQTPVDIHVNQARQAVTPAMIASKPLSQIYKGDLRTDLLHLRYYHHKRNLGGFESCHSSAIRGHCKHQTRLCSRTGSWAECYKSFRFLLRHGIGHWFIG